MSHDKCFGPLSREEVHALSAAPYGAAKEAIRRHDPYYGLADGASIKWRVRYQHVVINHGEAIVEAPSEDEARILANDLSFTKIRWDGLSADDDVDVIDVTPMAGG